jgi:energy-coupling factor transporter ATP-binding protein EcfA2
VDITSPRQAMRRGIYLVPEDRKRSGLILEMPVVENIALANLGAYARMSLVQRDQEVAVSSTQRKRLSVKAPGDQTQVVTLSGGNQQKVVLAKWLSMQPKVVIFDEPTRGVDVGAKNEIYGLMRDLADRGVAILMISSDMEEVIGVSDRIAVMHEGSISGVLERPRFSDHNVRSGSVSPSTFGNLYELYAIAAAVLRGCSLRGSEGSILGIVLGIASLQVPQNLVNILGIPSSLNFAVMGTVILLGVFGDQQPQRRRGGGDCRCRGAERPAVAVRGPGRA